MNKYSITAVDPIVNEHGEIIYELIEPNPGAETRRLSVAQVILPNGLGTARGWTGSDRDGRGCESTAAA